MPSTPPTAARFPTARAGDADLRHTRRVGRDGGAPQRRSARRRARTAGWRTPVARRSSPQLGAQAARPQRATRLGSGPRNRPRQQVAQPLAQPVVLPVAHSSERAAEALARVRPINRATDHVDGSRRRSRINSESIAHRSRIDPESITHRSRHPRRSLSQSRPHRPRRASRRTRWGHPAQLPCACVRRSLTHASTCDFLIRSDRTSWPACA